MAGSFHHQPRAAGVFVPGHATSSAGDPEIPKTIPRGITNESLAVQCPTPSPRRTISFTSPAETTLDRRASSFSVSPELPDNQLGLLDPCDREWPELAGKKASPIDLEPETSYVEPTIPCGGVPPPEVNVSAPSGTISNPPGDASLGQASTPPGPAEAIDSGRHLPVPDSTPIQEPGTSASPIAKEPVPTPEGARLTLEGTMYDDGTYWKKLVCKWLHWSSQ